MHASSSWNGMTAERTQTQNNSHTSHNCVDEKSHNQQVRKDMKLINSCSTSEKTEVVMSLCGATSPKIIQRLTINYQNSALA